MEFLILQISDGRYMRSEPVHESVAAAVVTQARAKKAKKNIEGFERP